jgi:hypothetical protein
MKVAYIYVVSDFVRYNYLSIITDLVSEQLKVNTWYTFNERGDSLSRRYSDKPHAS